MTQWHARMIAPDDEFGGAPLLRGELRLDEGHGEVAQATVGSPGTELEFAL